MNQHEIPCPVCGSTQYTVLYRPWREVTDPIRLFGAASGERGTQQIVRCRASGCGMVYVNPLYNDEIILKGYESAEDRGHDTQYESRVKTFYESLGKLRKFLPPPGSLALDIGCAGGAYLAAAERFGYKAVGLELSQKLAGLARQRGLEVVQGTLDAYRPSERFDLISLWDVLEHVTDPLKVLEQCRHLLRPSGILLVNYPDAGTWQAKLAGKRFWWFLSVHLHYFDRRSIRMILRQAEYDVLSVRPHFQSLELGYLFEVARIYSPALANLGSRFVPSFLKRWLIPYYASQTTVLAKPSP